MLWYGFSHGHPSVHDPKAHARLRWANGALAVALACSRYGRRRADVRRGMFASRPLRRRGDGRARVERRRTRRGGRRANRAGGRSERGRLCGVSRVPARVQSGTVLRLLPERRALHVGRGMLRRRVQRRQHVRKLRRRMHRRQRGVHEHTRLVLSRNDVLGRARQPLQRVHGSRRQLQGRHGLLQREVRYRWPLQGMLDERSDGLLATTRVLQRRLQRRHVRLKRAGLRARQRFESAIHTAAPSETSATPSEMSATR